METAAGTLSRAGETAAPSPLRCRKCSLHATVAGDPEFGRAFHTATGSEFGPDGHLTAPIDVPLDTPALAGSTGHSARPGDQHRGTGGEVR
jgi:hypothetical protein